MFYVELVKLAELQIECGALDKAKQTLMQALKYNPDYSWANLRMASLFLKEDNIEEAKKYLIHTLRTNIENNIDLNDAVTILWGDIARFKGEYNRAIIFYDEVLSSSSNIQILKSTLQKQLQILISVCHQETKELIEKYLNFDRELIISFIDLIYKICKRYNFQTYIELINNQYTYLSDELLSYRVNNLIISGSFSQAYNIISTIDVSHLDKKYQSMVMYAEINEFLGNKLLAIECLEKALSIRHNVTLKLKRILLLSEDRFNVAAEELRVLLANYLSEFTTKDWQLLLNNIKYNGADLFEYVVKKDDLIPSESNNENLGFIFSVEHRTVLIIHKYLNNIDENKLDLNQVFDFLKIENLNNLLKREILIQLYNGTYNITQEHFSFVESLNKHITRNDAYYRKLISIKLDHATQTELCNYSIVILNSTNIGDTILYLYSLFELYIYAKTNIILITCFENEDLINLVKGDWLGTIIYLSRQDITSRYCPYQEIRPVLPSNITYLSQGGKDRLQVSTKDGVWQGNFLNFRRLNVLDFYLRKHDIDQSFSPCYDIHYRFSQILKSNLCSVYTREQKYSEQKIVVIAPIANSLGYYFNLSEMNDFWVSLIDILTTASYKVKLLKSNKEVGKETNNLVYSITKYCKKHYNVSELDINLTDFVRYMESIDCFIGVRSGICDLISFLDSKNQKKMCIYPPNVNYCCGLSSWKYSNFIEYTLPNDYKVKIQKTTNEVYSLLQGG
jgi:tetratricopeptide (TPR) repeat protein